MKRIFTFFAVAAIALFAVSCDKEGGNKGGKGNHGGDAGESLIKIDGDFSDWAALEPSQYVSAKNNPESGYEGVKEIRVTADEDFVFYYIKYEKTTLDEQFELLDPLPIRLCINTDGEFTSGYDSYFLDAYDFIIEGALSDEAGHFTKFDGTFHQRVWVEEKGKMDWIVLLAPGNNLVTGMGSGTEYEIVLARDIFNNAVPSSTEPNSPIGDVFHTGIRFYCNSWSQLSNMPNAPVDESNTNGWGHLLEVKTIK